MAIIAVVFTDFFMSINNGNGAVVGSVAGYDVGDAESSSGGFWADFTGGGKNRRFGPYSSS